MVVTRDLGHVDTNMVERALRTLASSYVGHVVRVPVIGNRSDR